MHLHDSSELWEWISALLDWYIWCHHRCWCRHRLSAIPRLNRWQSKAKPNSERDRFSAATWRVQLHHQQFSMERSVLKRFYFQPSSTGSAAHIKCACPLRPSQSRRRLFLDTGFAPRNKSTSISERQIQFLFKSTQFKLVFYSSTVEAL